MTCDNFLLQVIFFTFVNNNQLKSYDMCINNCKNPLKILVDDNNQYFINKNNIGNGVFVDKEIADELVKALQNFVIDFETKNPTLIGSNSDEKYVLAKKALMNAVGENNKVVINLEERDIEFLKNLDVIKVYHEKMLDKLKDKLRGINGEYLALELLHYIKTLSSGLFQIYNLNDIYNLINNSDKKTPVVKWVNEQPKISTLLRNGLLKHRYTTNNFQYVEDVTEDKFKSTRTLGHNLWEEFKLLNKIAPMSDNIVYDHNYEQSKNSIVERIVMMNKKSKYNDTENELSRKYSDALSVKPIEIETISFINNLNLDLHNPIHRELQILKMSFLEESKKIKLMDWADNLFEFDKIPQKLYYNFKAVANNYNGELYIEDVTEENIINTRNVGKNCWIEFVKLRGY